MSTLTLDLFLDAPPPVGIAGQGDRGDHDARGGEPCHEAPPAAEARGRRTLDDLVAGVWEDLTAHHAAACPVCGGPMRPRYGSGAAPVGGRCEGCGSTLGWPAAAHGRFALVRAAQRERRCSAGKPRARPRHEPSLPPLRRGRRQRPARPVARSRWRRPVRTAVTARL
jgi:hypothetical protein